MFAKIQYGIGTPGKLWTGHEPEAGSFADCIIIERTCSCGASTRKFRAYPLENAAEDLDQYCEFPVVHIASGGVGSIYIDNDTPEDMTCWNWSHRQGGTVIVNPLWVGGEYTQKDDLPPAREGYKWIQTYDGDSWSEVVLIKEDHAEHLLPIIKLSGTCPPCREKQEAARLERMIQSGDLSPEQAIDVLKTRAIMNGCSNVRHQIENAEGQDGLYELLVENRDWVENNVSYQDIYKFLPSNWRDQLNGSMEEEDSDEESDESALSNHNDDTRPVPSL